MPHPIKKKKNPSGKVVYAIDTRIYDPKTGKRTRRIRGKDFEFDTRADAERVLSVLRLADQSAKYGFTPKPKRRPSLASVLDAYLETIDRRPERVRAERVFRSWISLLPVGIAAEDIHISHIRIFLDKRMADGLAASSVNRELNQIAAALHKAGELLPDLSQWKPPKIARPKVSQSRRERLITNEEYRAIVDDLTRPPDERDGHRAHDQKSAHRARLRVADLFRFAMLTGMRPQEMYALQWEDIDFDGSRIRVKGQKTQMVTNSTRYVPLTVSMREILDRQRRNKRDYIFMQGGNPTPKIYRILKSTCQYLGIPYGRKTQNGLELYCARHTFTTRLLQAGNDLATVGAITGHTRRELVLHYSHITPASTERAAAAIESIEDQRLDSGQKVVNLNTWKP